MKTTDIRFNSETMQVLRSLIGQRFDSIKHDPFIHVPSVYGIVGMFIGGKSYKLTNLIDVLDYYGQMEDVAVFRFEKAAPEEIKTFMDDGEMIDFPIQSQIHEIRVINENQRLYHNDEQTYDVYTIRGLIFVFEDGHELNLIDKFSPTEEFGEGWEGDYRGECSREIISIK